jgi:hypothetical protein
VDFPTLGGKSEVSGIDIKPQALTPYLPIFRAVLQEIGDNAEVFVRRLITSFVWLVE